MSVLLSTLGTFVSILAQVLTFAIFLRAILSWFPMGGNNPFVAFLYQITEPILAPLRQIVPRIGLIDITPIVAIFVLILVGRMAASL